MGMRSINETVNSVLKRTQIHFLRSRKSFMKKREFGWQIILYNIKRKIRVSSENNQTFIFYQIEIYSIRTKPLFQKIYKTEITIKSIKRWLIKKPIMVALVMLLELQA
jgi:hypothetical protein